MSVFGASASAAAARASVRTTAAVTTHLRVVGDADRGDVAVGLGPLVAGRVLAAAVDCRFG